MSCRLETKHQAAGIPVTIILTMAGVAETGPPKLDAWEVPYLLQDKIFTDYLNVFLAQPIFQVKCSYLYHNREFTFDPPCDPCPPTKWTLSWLMKTRIPLFVTTKLYSEYKLCQWLVRPSELRMQREKLEAELKSFQMAIGHVAGMRKFRHFLSASSGESLVNFWLDVEKVLKTPVEGADDVWESWRQVQIQYFQTTFFEDLCGRQSCNIGRLFPEATGDGLFLSHAQFQCLRDLQQMAVNILKEYWVPKYMIHLGAIDDRPLTKSERDADRVKLNAITNMEYYQLVKKFGRFTVCNSLEEGKLQMGPGGGLHQGGHKQEAQFSIEHSLRHRKSDGVPKLPPVHRSRQHKERVAFLTSENLQRLESLDDLSRTVRKPSFISSQSSNEDQRTRQVKTPALSLKSKSLVARDNEIMLQHHVQDSFGDKHQMVAFWKFISTPDSICGEPMFCKTRSYRFRAQEWLLVTCIADDSLAGGPFQAYLESQYADSVYPSLLSFWKDAQVLLSLPVESKTDARAETLTSRQAAWMIKTYLLPSGRRHIRFPAPLQRLMLRKLVNGFDAQDVLRCVQDAVCQTLKPALTKYFKHERRLFREEMGLCCHIGKTLPPPDGGYAILAFKLAQDIARSVTPGIPALVPSRDLQAADPTQDSGSLRVLSPVTRDTSWHIRNFVNQTKIDVSKIPAPRRKPAPPVTTKQAEGAAGMIQFDVKLPAYLRPFKWRNDKVYSRPPRPRTFMEILTNDIHREFFRKFLIHCGASDVAVRFWQDVQEMKNKSHPKTKINKVNLIVKKYFTKKMREKMDCNADIIETIPKVCRVTPPMLISAQSCVAKTLEEKWNYAYLDTFPEIEHRQEARSVHTTEIAAAVVRTWTKEKTRNLWIGFLRTVIHFRRTILDPTAIPSFMMYIKYDIAKELNKLNERRRQQVRPGEEFIPYTGPIKKVMKRKLIIMEKLPKDLEFWIEVDKFRELCAMTNEDAEAGNFSKDHQDLLERKTKTIIECFLESEIPPKLQINIPQELADRIISDFQSGILDRGLFHQALLSIFPTLIHMWKKFNKHRFAPPSDATVKVEPSVPLKSRPKGRVTPHANSPIPDFFALSVEKAKKIIKRATGVDVFSDVEQRFLFSLQEGLRHVVPMTREEMNAMKSTRSQSSTTLHTGTADTKQRTNPAASKMSLKNASRLSIGSVHRKRSHRNRMSANRLARGAQDPNNNKELKKMSLPKLHISPQTSEELIV